MYRDFDNETKSIDRARPFHRVNSRNYDLNPAPGGVNDADGLAHRCGARNAEDYQLSTAERFLLNRLRDFLRGLAIALAAAIIAALASGNALAAALLAAAEIPIRQLLNQLENLITGRALAIFIRHVPAWVPVGRNGYDRNFSEQDREVEGRLTRSFQSCYGIPLYQWKNFYTWNFHVQNETAIGPVTSGDHSNGFAYVIGRGNRATADEATAAEDSQFAPAYDMAERSNQNENSIECILDVGAFSRICCDYSIQAEVNRDGFPHGLMFHPLWPFWPQINDWFWAQGRWVYDCRHFHESDTPDPQASPKTQEQMWTQLHPIRAFAFYRYEGYQFKENPAPTPAARFQFFSCIRGGYHDFNHYSDLSAEDDPQFIVDLPALPEELTPVVCKWTLGQYMESAPSPDRIRRINTGVTRSLFIYDIQMAPYKIDHEDERLIGEGIVFDETVQPKIEPIVPEEGTIPRQVKITVPLSTIPSGANAYGFVVNLGYRDRDGILARQVKCVSILLDHLSDLFRSPYRGEYIRFRFSINGRLKYEQYSDLDRNRHVDENGNVIVTASRIVLWIPVDEVISIHSSGIWRRGRGECFEERQIDAVDLNRRRRLTMVGLLPHMPDAIRTILTNSVVSGLIIAASLGTISQTDIDDFLRLWDENDDGGDPITWREHIDQESDAVASRVARALRFHLAVIGRENRPLGFIDNERVMIEARPEYGTHFFNAASPEPPLPPLYTGFNMTDLMNPGDPDQRTENSFVLIARRVGKEDNDHFLLRYWFQTNLGRFEDYRLQTTIVVNHDPT